MTTAAVEVRERPILMSAPMVRAILDGGKTQTRRVVKPQPHNPEMFGVSPVWGYGVPRERIDSQKRFGIHAAFNVDGKRVDRWLPCHYGAPGDRLWVRETWWHYKSPEIEMAGFAGGTMMRHRDGSLGVYHENDDFNAADHAIWRKRPSIHMPRWASRLTLEITGVRVERLRDITEADAIAEGFRHHTGTDFADYWDSLNAKRGYPWASNPWVWVIEFTKEPA